MSYDELMEKYQKLETQNQNLEVENQNLINEVDNLKLQIQNLNKIIFGSRRERTPHVDQNVVADQVSLFTEKSEEAQENQVQEEEQKQIEEMTVNKKKDRKKKEKKAGIKKSYLKDIKIIRKEYVLEDDENQRCPICNSELEKIGKKVVREEINYIPPRIEIHTYVQNVYKCKKCGSKDSKKDTPTIVQTQIPNALLPHSFASASLAGEVIYKKFYMGVPFYRQEKVWDDIGLVLPRNMMAKWAIKITEYYLQYLYKLMFKKLKEESKIGHSDETTIQCNKEKGRNANSKSYMWVFVSGVQEEHQGVIFKYAPSRSGETAQNFLRGFKGTLITDGYEAYKNINGLTAHAECWAHARRKFYESVPIKDKELDKEAIGYPGVDYCNKLFEVERQITEQKMNNEERLKIRKEKSAVILKDFYDWVYSLNEKYIANKKLKEAITYAINQKECLSEFLNSGDIPLDNSRAERTIRPFAIHRKNWLFADSVDGAKTNAVMYSFIETAKLNKLNIYEYIKYLLDELPQLEDINDEKALEKYLPWSKDLPKNILNFQGTYEELDLEKNCEIVTVSASIKPQV